MTVFDQLLLANHIVKRRAIPQAPQSIQNLRNSIIGEHGNLVNVLKLTESLSIKRSPQICYANLSTFEEANTFPILKAYDIIEAREIVSQEVDECRSGMIGFCNTVRKVALVLLQAAISDKFL